VAENEEAVRDGIPCYTTFQALACPEALNRDKTTFFEGYVTKCIGSADVLFCLPIYFHSGLFFGYMPLKVVRTDSLTAVRIRVKHLFITT
jgi:hypothetical protein